MAPVARSLLNPQSSSAPYNETCLSVAPGSVGHTSPRIFLGPSIGFSSETALGSGQSVREPRAPPARVSGRHGWRARRSVARGGPLPRHAHFLPHPRPFPVPSPREPDALSVSSSASAAAAPVPGEAAATHEGAGWALRTAGLAGVGRR